MKLVLNDGTEIENGRAGCAEGFLWCYFTGTMEQAASLFLDTEKTSKIVFEYGSEQDVFNGFTFCRCLMAEKSGSISVCMIRGNENG